MASATLLPRRAGIASVTTFLGLATIAVPHASAQQAPHSVVISQGDRIRVNGTSMCTVGLNDFAKGVSLTAAHCGKAGAPVSIVADDGRMMAKDVGIFTPSASFIEGGTTHTDANDVGTIEWDSTVVLGENTFSGDSVVSPKDITADDRVCFHGTSSHGDSASFTCGPVISTEKDTLYFDASSLNGDSGGPVWVEGKGFAGVLSGLLIGPNDEFRISYASLGENGSTSDLNREIMPMWENYQLAQSDITYDDDSVLSPVKTANYQRATEPTVVNYNAETANDGSSGSMGIVAAILGVIATVGALFGFMQI